MDILHTFVTALHSFAPLFVLIAAYTSAVQLLPTDFFARRHTALLAVLFSVAMVYVLHNAFMLAEGVQLDPRYAVQVLAGVFGGPLVALIAGGVGLLIRGMIGGEGAQAAYLLQALCLALTLALSRMYLPKGIHEVSGRKVTMALLMGAGIAGASSLTTLPILAYLELDDPFSWQTAAAFCLLQVVLTLCAGSLLLVDRLRLAKDDLLKKSAREMQAVLATLPDSLMLHDEHGTPLKALNTPQQPSHIRRASGGQESSTALHLPEALAREVLATNSLREARTSLLTNGNLTHFELRSTPFQGGRVLTSARDITLKVEHEARLKELQRNLNLLVTNTQDMMGLVGPEGFISYAIPSCDRLAERSPLGLQFIDWALPAEKTTAAELAEVLYTIAHCTAPFSFKTVFRTMPGRRGGAWLELTLSTLIEHGKPTGQAMFVARDITERQHLESRAQLAELAINHLRDGVAITRVEDNTLVWANEGFYRLSGHSESEAVGQSADVLLNSFPVEGAENRVEALERNGLWSGELLSQRKDGGWFAEWRAVCLFENHADGLPYYVNLVHDLSKERPQEHALDSLKLRDPLTGLPNRGEFLSVLESALISAEQNNAGLAVLLFNLRRLSAVNRSHGRAVGDKLVRAVVQRVRTQFGLPKVLARLETDKFALILEDASSEVCIQQQAESLLDCLAEPFDIDGVSLLAPVNVGIARFPADGLQADALLHRSALALEDSWARGDGFIEFFKEGASDTALRKLSIESALRRTLLHSADELQIEYQPKVRLSDGQVVGFEALARWKSLTLGGIAPAEFISVAEDSGLVHFLGSWAFDTICGDLAAWRDSKLLVKPVAVNLSAKQLHDDKLSNRLLEAAKKHNVPPSWLELEITEQGLVLDLDLAQHTLRSLRAAGFKVALDDFGTGYSSMSYLQKLPLDTLKLDKSFVDGAGTDNESSAVARTIIGLAKSLSLSTVAEGVETEVQREFLASVGCDSFQGYLFSPAIPPNEVRRYLRARPMLVHGA